MKATHRPPLAGSINPQVAADRPIFSNSHPTADSVLTTKQWLDLGVSSGELRGPGFVQVIRGVHTLAENPLFGTLGLRVQAAVAATGGKTVVCGTTALQLWRVHLPFRLVSDQRIHLLVPRGTRRSRREDIAIHQYRDLSNLDLHEMRGFHLVGPIEAWLEVARHATHEELVQIGDGLVRYQNPITSLGAIRQFLNQPGGGLPTSRALAALADMRQGTDSIAETIVRRWIVTSRLPEPQVNRILTDADGQFMARVDCFIEQYQTVAEYDGMVHEGEHSRTRDNIRRDLLRRNGIEVVVATRADLADPSRFLQTLLAALSRQAKALRLPIPQMSPLGLGK